MRRFKYFFLMTLDISKLELSTVFSSNFSPICQLKFWSQFIKPKRKWWKQDHWTLKLTQHNFEAESLSPGQSFIEILSYFSWTRFFKKQFETLYQMGEKGGSIIVQVHSLRGEDHQMMFVCAIHEQNELETNHIKIGRFTTGPRRRKQRERCLKCTWIGASDLVVHRTISFLSLVARVCWCWREKSEFSRRTSD